MLRTPLKHKKSSGPGRARRLAVVTGVTIGAVGGGAFIASAAIPGADNTVTGCQAASGPLRLIDTDANQACTAAETKVSWGGGMRFRGVWSEGPNGELRPPAGLYGTVKKGDVIRYEGSLKRFGCTSPKGTWVNVAGSYAYPCLEFPQNWAPVALDGQSGPAYHVRVGLNDLNTDRTAGGRTTIKTWNYGDIAWIHMPQLDVTKCSVAATPITSATNATVTRADMTYKDWIALYTNVNGARSRMPVDVTIACPES